MHPALPYICLALMLSGCVAPPATPATPAARVLVFGEQHDQPDQQRQVAAVVRSLAEGGRLAAVIIEMADAGRSTAGLPADAGDDTVRDALAWKDWAWNDYAGVVMASVRQQVPVLGGNLPRAAMRDAMRDASLDARIPQSAAERLTDAVRSGHCGLLPAAQEPGMLRIQIARDVSMARTVMAALDAAGPGQQVLLLTGAQHASRDRGVPLHLANGTKVHVTLFGDSAPGLVADEWRDAVSTPRPDPCDGLKKRMGASPTAPAFTP